MSDPKDQQQQERGEGKLELDAETVKDLEPDPESADAVRGGPCWCSFGGNNATTGAN